MTAKSPDGQAYLVRRFASGAVSRQVGLPDLAKRLRAESSTSFRRCLHPNTPTSLVCISATDAIRKIVESGDYA